MLAMSTCWIPSPNRNGKLSYLLLLQVNSQQIPFQNICQFHNGFIILATGVFCSCWENRNAIVNTVLQGKLMVIEFKIPAYSIKIIFFVGKNNLEVISQNISDLVKSF